MKYILSATLATSLVAACSTGEFTREAGASLDDGSFGNATMNNSLIQSGQLSYTISLQNRFSDEVSDTINFEFNSAQLTPQAQAILQQQAGWIRQFPEVRFKVFGHTDLVGSNAYNRRLGLRRAQAAVNYLIAQGIDRSRLQAVVTYGETRPVVQTQDPEMRNRRTVTEVSGFVENHPLVLNGKYAEVIFREYVTSAQPASTLMSVGEGTGGGGGGGGTN